MGLWLSGFAGLAVGFGGEEATLVSAFSLPAMDSVGYAAEGGPLNQDQDKD